jgi:hypothetical protein
MVRAADELWSLIWNRHWLEPEELWRRMSITAAAGGLDHRTARLIRDCLDALEQKLGPHELARRIAASPASECLGSLRAQQSDDVGLPSIGRRIVEPLARPRIDRFFTYLGGRLRQPVQIIVGGSIALMLQDLFARQTENVDVVNDIPEPIRRDHQLLLDLRETQQLHLGQFASRYLPTGWELRTRTYRQFDRLTVRLVDAVDVLTGKLFSKRNKDLLDLQEAWPLLDQVVFRQRLAKETAGLRGLGDLGERATLNWKVVTGETSLPPER